MYVTDEELYRQLRVAAATQDPALQPTLDALRADVAALADQPAPAVTDKDRLPQCPEVGPHDYVSLGTYWWPDPDQPNGLPYVRRDGRVNPEGSRYDLDRWNRCSREIIQATRAAFFFENGAAAMLAADRARRWFIDPESRMTPHLLYAQMIPGRCTGRGIGIIDFALRLPAVLDHVALLAELPATPWSPDDQRAFKTWCEEFLTWLETHPYGLEERATHNNHGTWYDVQVVTLGLFVDRPESARQTLADVRHRIASQIEPDGSMPLELARTRSLSYTIMNTRGFVELALMGRQLGVELWDWQTEDGRGLRRAADYLYEFASSERAWPWEQIDEVDWGKAALTLARAERLQPDRYPLQALAHRLPQNFRLEEYVLRQAAF